LGAILGVIAGVGVDVGLGKGEEIALLCANWSIPIEEGLTTALA